MVAGDGDGESECIVAGPDGDAASARSFSSLVSFKAGVTGSALTFVVPLTFGVEGWVFALEEGDGDGDGVGITACVFFFKKLWSTVNWIA